VVEIRVTTCWAKLKQFCHLLLNCSNNIVYDDVEKAEGFNTFFSSQSNIDDTDKSVPADETPPPRCLDRIVLRQHEVQDVLRLLDTNKASAPDAIHAKLLKVAYDIISKPLCAIFSISLITKHFPNKWKLATSPLSTIKRIKT
jgi:hypothetical protein